MTTDDYGALSHNALHKLLVKRDDEITALLLKLAGERQLKIDLQKVVNLLQEQTGIVSNG